MRPALLAVPFLLAGMAGLLPAAARAERTLLLTSDGSLGVLRVTLPAEQPAGPMPVVVILPDGPDAGSRADPVVDRLRARGIAVIETDVEDGFPADPDPADLTAALEEAVPGWLDPRRIGVLGFGAGARAALRWPGVPVVALYPACAGAPVRVVAAGALILHADDPAERAACARLPAQAEAVPGTTHAWDHRHGPGEETVARLPHPDGGGSRLTARRYPWAIEFAAERITAHLAAALLNPMSREAAPVVHARGEERP